MCFFAVTAGTITVIVFYHGNVLHGNYRSFTAVKIPRGMKKLCPLQGLYGETLL